MKMTDIYYASLYIFAFVAAIGTCSQEKYGEELEAITEKQSELETICRSNGALHIKNVTGGPEEDVYFETYEVDPDGAEEVDFEADGKRFFLYVDGKAVTQQPE